MDVTYLLKNWGPCRAALHQAFPDYNFPAATPSLREFEFALDGLTVIAQLTRAELIETLIDHMIFVLPAREERAAA